MQIGQKTAILLLLIYYYYCYYYRLITGLNIL